MVTRILGISAFFHDSAAALLSDGRMVAAAQEERFTRRKGEARFPSSSVDYCLREAGLGPSELDHVVFYEKLLVKFDRLLRTWSNVAPAGWLSARQALPLWTRHRLDVARHLRRDLGSGFRGELSYAGHHESHAASAFFPSPYAPWVFPRSWG